jgi:EAL domain-containing protein (putative c-di-GMP-specific phosphodiesterase class I)/GGDEF domain-containing protein
MSLIRQMWLVVLTTVVLAFAGSFAVTIVSAREYVQTQLRVKNSDNAAALALSLSQQGGDRELMELLVAAQFDTGFYEQISFAGTDGRVIERLMRQVPVDAPAWFVRLVPLDSVPGVAQVSDGWQALGSVTVVSHAAYAYRDLWRATLQAAVWLSVVGLLAGLMGHFMVGGIRRPLGSTVRQAQALVNGQYLTVDEPRVPELQRLTRAMNAMVQRVRLAFEEQALQVETFRRAASRDPLTGVLLRQHVLTGLDLALHSDDSAPHGGLLLVRLEDLAAVNARLGRLRTDELLVAMAQALRQLADVGAEASLGRLNGSDFAVILPGQIVREKELDTVREALRQACRAIGDENVAVVMAATAYRHGEALSTVLARADEGLARAEAQGPFSTFVHNSDAPAGLGGGEAAWKRSLMEALEQHRVDLGHYPLRNASGALIHHECPLRLQLAPQGAYESAAVWLPLAMRTQATDAVDLCAVSEALRRIAADGQPRGVNLATASVCSPDFGVRLRELVRASGPAAAQLWLELPESAAVQQPTLVRELSQQLKGSGVRLGLEHAGEQLARIDRLYEMGLDFVKIDARFIRGVAQEPAARNFLRSTATLAHGLGLQVYAEGVADAADLLPLWACGLDGATGPAVT